MQCIKLFLKKIPVYGIHKYDWMSQLRLKLHMATLKCVMHLVQDKNIYYIPFTFNIEKTKCSLRYFSSTLLFGSKISKLLEGQNIIRLCEISDEICIP